MVVHGVDSLVKSDGVKLSCGNDGIFALIDLSTVDKNKFLISTDGERVRFEKHEDWIERNPDALAAYLAKHESYRNLQPEARKVLAKSVFDDLNRYTKMCKQYGSGYTQVFRVESDKPAVKAGQEVYNSKTAK